MADAIIYDLNGNFQCVLRDGMISFGPGTNLWVDYVAQNGVPPATGIPTNKPARIPEDYKVMFQTIKSYTQAQQLQIVDAVVCWVLVNNPLLAAQINTTFSLNPPLPFDKPNS